LLIAMVLMLGACGRGGDTGQDLGAASGNSLTPAQIDAALGPANQQELLANEVNGTAAVRERAHNGGESAHPGIGQESNTTQLNAETSTPPR
jgi:hypothetical protein